MRVDLEVLREMLAAYIVENFTDEERDALADWTDGLDGDTALRVLEDLVADTRP